MPNQTTIMDNDDDDDEQESAQSFAAKLAESSSQLVSLSGVGASVRVRRWR
jgi:hypothetical protein